MQKATELLDIPLAELTEVEQETLLERRLVSADFLEQSHPKAYLLSRDEKLSVMIGEEDQLRIQSLHPGFDLLSAYAQAKDMADALEQRRPLAFDADLGYLTACPSNTGSGMRVSVMVHLPALTESRQIDHLAQQMSKLGYTLRGYHGEHSDRQTGLVQLSNQVTLGVDDRELLKEFVRLIRRILKLEDEATMRWLVSDREKLEDRLWRSLGVLMQARLLTADEARHCLSDLYLGLRIGVLPLWLETKTLSRLWLSIEPANLQRSVGRPLAARDRDRIRAMIVRQTLDRAREATASRQRISDATLAPQSKKSKAGEDYSPVTEPIPIDETRIGRIQRFLRQEEMQMAQQHLNDDEMDQEEEGDEI